MVVSCRLLMAIDGQMTVLFRLLYCVLSGRIGDTSEYSTTTECRHSKLTITWQVILFLQAFEKLNNTLCGLSELIMGHTTGRSNLKTGVDRALYFHGI